MKIIREYSTYAKMCIVRTNTYNSFLSHFLELYEIAKKDFPALKTTEVKIVKYAGTRQARTFGIEFLADPKSVPIEYLHIKNLEYT